MREQLVKKKSRFNRNLLVPLRFFQSFLSFSSDDFLALVLQRHGGRADRVSEVSAATQAKTTASHHRQNRGSDKHAHLQWPKTARERDHGLRGITSLPLYPLGKGARKHGARESLGAGVDSANAFWVQAPGPTRLLSSEMCFLWKSRYLGKIRWSVNLYETA